MWQRKDSKREPMTAEQLYTKAAAYCSVAEHCPTEVREKLRTWGADTDQLDDIIDHLTDENFINEDRYCRAFVNDKIRFQSWGKEKIRMALAAKHLPSGAITEAIDAFPEEDYRAILEAVIAKKAQQLKDEEEEAFQGKMLRFLLGRGFSYSDIQSALAEM